MLVGLLVNAAPLSHLALALVIAYGAYYGLVESAGRTGLPPPGRRWQVPSRWVDKAPRWRRILVWGSLLGPGFATRNPYAGFGMLLLVVGSIGSLRLGIAVAALLGLLHAAGRAAALLRDTHRTADADYLRVVMKSIRWRTADGLALLASAGVALMTIAFRG
jgi:hypothetical protein